MELTILTGPPGAGKNTVGELYARKRERCALVDIDLVRWMVLQPHRAPWEGEGGKRQQLLGIKNGCMLARSFIDEGFRVVLLDVISNETAAHYAEHLKGYDYRIILLLPVYEEVLRRNRSRGIRLKQDEIAMLYTQQSSFTGYDRKIDNTALSPDQVADMILVPEPE